MATPEDFARSCREAARNTRRLPKDLRDALKARTRPEVTEPLAQDIGAAATGPHRAILTAGTKARTSATPDIVIGGTRPKLSGGAGPRDVVAGDEFGGSSRRGAVRASTRAKAHTRRTTRQFTRRPFVFRTLAQRAPWVLDRYADIVDDVLEVI